ncbi:unnamed protein product [Macrosiphum euphorbiae]|uniref:Uncharacterized protein n=1 Tax=Macrosiphum euphorbiae TaxID=13131 RepID=A0AAV0XGX7_9HEMI|nr:unnamed protein product [Macrosiphum euphorbiae]
MEMKLSWVDKSFSWTNGVPYTRTRASMGFLREHYRFVSLYVGDVKSDFDLSQCDYFYVTNLMVKFWEINTVHSIYALSGSVRNEVGRT